jgi:hypothetical protein
MTQEEGKYLSALSEKTVGVMGHLLDIRPSAELSESAKAFGEAASALVEATKEYEFFSH